MGGLSWDTGEDGLRSFFSQFGPIDETIIMRDPITKQPRGFGFVTFQDSASVDRLLQGGNFVQIDGRKVEVKRAVSREAMRQQTANRKVFVGGLDPKLVDSGCQICAHRALLKGRIA